MSDQASLSNQINQLSTRLGGDLIRVVQVDGKKVVAFNPIQDASEKEDRPLSASESLTQLAQRVRDGKINPPLVRGVKQTPPHNALSLDEKSPLESSLATPVQTKVLPEHGLPPLYPF